MVAGGGHETAEGAIRRAPSGGASFGGIRRAPSGDFKRVGSGGSVVTFDRATSGGFARASSGGSHKGTFLRVGSNITRVPSQVSGGIAKGGASVWAKLRAVAVVTNAHPPTSDAGFSRVSSGFQRVPSANAPGSLGFVVPLMHSQSLTEAQSLQKSRQEVKQWKEEQSRIVQEKIVDLEARMSRLSTLDDRLTHNKHADDGGRWSDVLPGAVPDKIETETQKFLLAKQATTTVRSIVNGDIEMPPTPTGHHTPVSQMLDDNNMDVVEWENALKGGHMDHVYEVGSKPSTANTHIADDDINEIGWQKRKQDIDMGGDYGGLLELARDNDQEKKEEKEKENADMLHNPPLPHKDAIIIKTLYDCCTVSCPWMCGGFSHKSWVRNVCFGIYSSRYLQNTFQLIWISNVIFIAVSPTLNRLIFHEVFLMNTTELVSLGYNGICVLVLFIEVTSGVIVLGLLRGPSAWLGVSVFNKIDLVVLLVCILEGVGAIFSIPVPTLRPFRMLRVFKNVSQLAILKGFDIIVETLDQCAGQILTIALICTFYFAIFAIFGMAMYQKSFRRSCVVVGQPVPSCASDFTTSWNNACSKKDFVAQAWIPDSSASLLVSSR